MNILIISNGNVGSALARKLSFFDYKVSMYSRDYENAVREYDKSKVKVEKNLFEALENAKIIFIATKDRYITNLVVRINKIRVDLSEKSFVHLSGLEKSDILDDLKKKGANIGSLHPLQTFPLKHLPKLINDIYFIYEGDVETKKVLKPMVHNINCKFKTIDKENKTMYHLAAVFSSNLLLSLFNISDGILKDIGIEEGVGIHEKIIKTTISNMFKYGQKSALSGPIKRGDTKTIGKHLKEIEKKDIKKIYSLLSKEALEMSMPDEYNEIKKILDDNS